MLPPVAATQLLRFSQSIWQGEPENPFEPPLQLMTTRASVATAVTLQNVFPPIMLVADCTPMAGGLTVGCELYFWDLIWTTTYSDGSTTGAENRGLTTRPLFGYKHVSPVGFTIDAQLGYGHIV